MSTGASAIAATLPFLMDYKGSAHPAVYIVMIFLSWFMIGLAIFLMKRMLTPKEVQE